MLICPYQGDSRKQYSSYPNPTTIHSASDYNNQRAIIDLSGGAGEASLDTQVLQDFLIIDQNIKSNKKHLTTDLDECPIRTKDCNCHRNDQRQSNSSDEATYSSSKIYQAGSNSSSLLSVSQNSQNVDLLLDIITDKVRDIQDANDDITKNLKEAESILCDLRKTQAINSRLEVINENSQNSEDQNAIIRRRKNLPKINETEAVQYNNVPLKPIEVKTQRRQHIPSPISNFERCPVTPNNGSMSVPVKRKEYTNTGKIIKYETMNLTPEQPRRVKLMSDFKATSNLDVRCSTTRRLLSASNSNSIDNLNRTVKYHYCNNYPQ